mmetsp:Transcript_150522/g.483914  ORF Transcript_150522/g.483914 Transcript_150522/m.483914 type:complete len:341 (+) Transcript_150522:2020-3042(+)
MHQHKSLQVAELADGEVGVVDGLTALAPGDADAHLRLLDHGHIVRAVADGERHGRRLHALADELDHLRFLQRRHAASDDHGAGLGHVQELLLHHDVAQDDFQSRSCHHDRLVVVLLISELARPIPQLARRGDVPARGGLLDLGNGHSGDKDLGTEADVPGGLKLVAGQDPQFDARNTELLNGVRHLVLELILDGRDADDVEVHLDLLSNLVQGCFPVRQGSLGLLILHQPRNGDRLRDLALPDEQRPESLCAEIRQEFIQLLVLGVFRCPLLHHVVCALDQERILLSLFDEHRHPLAIRVEGVGREDLVLQFLRRLRLVLSDLLVGHHRFSTHSASENPA